MLTSEQVQQFQRDGYLIDRKVFTESELADLRRLALRVKTKAISQEIAGLRYWYSGKRREEIPVEKRGLATWGVNMITRPPLFEPDLVSVFGHPRVDQALQALVTEPRAWAIKILWTPKIVGYDLHWHRDQVGRDLYDYVHLKPAAQDHVQFNAALHDDACFRVVPGSHRRALTKAEWHAVTEDRTANLPGEVVAELAPGDILYMDAHALHRGSCGVDTDRLTLHYSVQAQRYPLQPWGTPEEWAFITSDEFLNRLIPAARPYYERLRTAETTDDKMSWLKAIARDHGWRAGGREA